MISDGFYTCNKCGFWINGNCIIKNIQTDAKHSCKDFAVEIPLCDNCHNITLMPLYWTREDDEVKILCQNCFRRM